jgi:hypothetical protein
MNVSNKLNVKISQANKVEKGFENMRDDKHTIHIVNRELGELLLSLAEAERGSGQQSEG